MHRVSAQLRASPGEDVYLAAGYLTEHYNLRVDLCPEPTASVTATTEQSSPRQKYKDGQQNPFRMPAAGAHLPTF